MWPGAVRRWHASCSRAGRFGSQQFWESQYAIGKAPSEWFLSASLAAASTAEAFGAHERRYGSVGAYARVLHLGCGTSDLGSTLVAALASELRISARVMNVDSSPTAVATALKAVGPLSQQQQQMFRVWDAAGGTPPPAMPSPLFSCGPSARYDLLVDKGTLDAFCFASEGTLVTYLAAVRACLLAPSVEHGVPAMYVHYTDDPPEVRGELFAAAFPATGEERWCCACAVVEEEEDGGGDGGYYRYTVHHEP